MGVCQKSSIRILIMQQGLFIINSGNGLAC